MKEDLKLKETNDYELIMLYREDDENAKNILYYKYRYIIDILIKKYSEFLSELNIDYQEIYSECAVGFSDALRSYQDDKDATLLTFLNLCIERRIRGMIRKYSRDKYKTLKDAYSLDFPYKDGKPLMEVISDEGVFDPLNNVVNNEDYVSLLKRIEKKLTSQEYEVFLLMVNGMNYQEIAKILQKTPKQVDNTMQRIKNKIKRIINKEEDE